MENELAKVVNARSVVPGSQAVADDNFNMNGWAMGSSSGVAVSSIPTLHSSAEEFSQWVASTFGTTNNAVLLPPLPPPTLVSLSWEATVPVVAYSLDPSSPNVPAGFPITELHAIAKTGLDHFVFATSSTGKPLFGAYVVNSLGEHCLQQLFEFSPTAFDAGVFLPVPTVGGHFQGAYGLDYARHRFCGSIASLPRLMRWPATATRSVSPASVSGLNLGPSFRHDLFPASFNDPAAASNSVPSTYHDCVKGSFMCPQLPALSHRELLPDAHAVSNQLVASSCTDRVVSLFKDAPEKHLKRVPSSCSNEGVSPFRTPEEHPQQQVLEPGMKAASSALQVTFMSPQLPTLSHREMLEANAVSSQLVASSYTDRVVSSFKNAPEKHLQRVPSSCSNEGVLSSPLTTPDHEHPPPQGVGPSSCPNEGVSRGVSPLRTPDEHPQQQVPPSCSSELGVSPLTTPDEHPQQRVLEALIKAAASALQVTSLPHCKEVVSEGAGTSRKRWVEAAEKTQVDVAKRSPDRCHPCFLCDSCKEHWGIAGLPEKHFENPRKEVFRPPEEDVPAILCSKKTAARKRKWAQCRHGPKSKTSEYRGVNLYKRTWKWEAHIWHQCEQLYLGASITKTHAAEVYDKAALFLFGPDAEINFQPEGYQKEYEFMHRLTYGQMVVYLRRESRQNGEEVRYPGVAKVKAKLFCASYRPKKEKESHEHIGYYETEDDAVRAVLKEAVRRKNYEMAGKILDVHHVRAVKPAPGYIKQTRQARAASIVAAIKVAGLESSRRPSKRAKRVAANATSATQTQAAAIPIQEVAIAPPKRKYVRKTAKSKPSPAAKDNTSTVPVSKEEHRSQETGATPAPRRKYIRKSTKTQQKSTPKRSTKGPLPAEEVIGLAPVAVPVEAPLSQEARAARKRKITTVKLSKPSAAANKSDPAGSTPVTTRLRQGAIAVAEEAPPAASPAKLRVFRPIRPREPSTPTSLARNSTSSKVLHPNAAPQPMTDVAPAAPVSPVPPAQIIPASSAHPFMSNQPPVIYDFMSGTWSGPQITGSDYSSTHAYSADVEGESSGAQDSGSTNSSCLSYQTTGLGSKLTGLSFQTPPRAVVLYQPREKEMRQFQEACNWLAMQRRNLQGAIFNSRPPPSPESPGVIRPVARRLSLTNRQAGAHIAANPFPLDLEGGGRLYVDLFGPPALQKPVV